MTSRYHTERSTGGIYRDEETGWSYGPLPSTSRDDAVASTRAAQRLYTKTGTSTKENSRESQVELAVIYGCLIVPAVVIVFFVMIFSAFSAGESTWDFLTAILLKAATLTNYVHIFRRSY